MNSVVPQGTHPAAERALQPERRVRWHQWQRHNRCTSSRATQGRGLRGCASAGRNLRRAERTRGCRHTRARPHGHGHAQACSPGAGRRGPAPSAPPGVGPGFSSGVRNRPPTTAGKRPSVTPVSQRRMFGARFPRWAAVFRPEAAPRLQSHLVLLPPRFSPRGLGPGAGERRPETPCHRRGAASLAPL